jgi:hypothetical protein
MKKLSLACLALIAVVIASPWVLATVSTTSYSVTHTGNGGSTYTITFPFIAKNQITVVKETIATGATVTLTQDTQYTVTLPRTGVNGSITTIPATTSAYRLIITRSTPLTQTTSFKTQGSFLPVSHENAFDKLTMIAQELADGVVVSTDIDAAITSHEAESDPHTGYLKLAGRAGGQTASGGTAASENLTLRTTTNATKGKIIMGSAGTELVVDDVNNRVGVNNSSPAKTLDVVGDVLITDSDMIIRLDDSGIEAACGDNDEYLDIVASTNTFSYDGGNIRLYGPAHLTEPGVVRINSFVTDFRSQDGAQLYATIDADGLTMTDAFWIKVGLGGFLETPTIRGGDGSGEDLTILSTSNATKGSIFMGSSGTELVVDDLNNRVGVGVATPSVELEVNGRIAGRDTVNYQDAGTYTVDAAKDCGGVLHSAQIGYTVTLPDLSSSVNGCRITLINTATSGSAQVAISPHSSDSIFGTCSTSGVDYEFSGAVDKDAINTLATANKGDYITVVGAYVAKGPGWWVVGCAGTWASEP